MTKAEGSFELASWDEDSYQELDGASKLTLAAVTQKFDGDITGEGASRWLMFYRDDGTAHFVGLQRVTGGIGTRSGSFVLETTGDFDGKTAKWEATVVPGSGTGELEGLTGTGKFGAPKGPKATFELDYRFK